jgi:serine/threonine-protein kinase
MSERGLCGSALDRYWVDRWLGGGGFGAVYEAVHTVMQRPVALKVLHDQPQGDPHLTERFLREARAAAAIGNPHIVQVFDAGTTEAGHPFLAMEYIDGCSLGDVLEGGPLEPERMVSIALQVLEALAQAHRAGIIHRDVKPGNVMLAGTTRDGGNRADFVKLVDFGISKVARPLQKDSEITRTGMTMGTPGYAAPEQYISARRVDARSDIYSVSVLLYRTLADRLPFEADTYEQMVLQVCGSDPHPLARVAPNLPAKLCEIIDQGLSRNPKERWQSAEAFAEALAPFGSRAPASHAHASPAANLPTAAGEARPPTPAELAPTTPPSEAAVAAAGHGASSDSQSPPSEPWNSGPAVDSPPGNVETGALSPRHMAQAAAQAEPPAPPRPADASPADDPGTPEHGAASASRLADTPSRPSKPHARRHPWRFALVGGGAAAAIAAAVALVMSPSGGDATEGSEQPTASNGVDDSAEDSPADPSSDRASAPEDRPTRGEGSSPMRVEPPDDRASADDADAGPKRAQPSRPQDTRKDTAPSRARPTADRASRQNERQQASRNGDPAASPQPGTTGSPGTTSGSKDGSSEDDWGQLDELEPFDPPGEGS